MCLLIAKTFSTALFLHIVCNTEHVELALISTGRSRRVPGAVVQRHEAVVKKPLEKGADVDAWATLHMAAERGHEAAVQLLEKGAHINVKICSAGNSTTQLFQ